ncbi:hypothetical protein NW767_013815 [Fusarium falciforme]|uniref:Beta-galactosidase trimerisation domain-containing protein n=1 Tax=Fusarium falciforme TaxID=195108 RepID=A0A9W8UUQ6_9HYPO|nr:hypothetical protein NW755_014305 [Fusarium falciforme]KAJ4182628.1 hypothetical protein NW767_013815 [Fusarium falciforme]
MGDPSILKEDLWWRKPFGMLQTNLREIDADMGVEEVADYIEQHGADAWLIGIGGIQAQYPTKLPFHAKNSLLSHRKSGDLILDAITVAHTKGMRLLARMDFSKVSAEIAAQHPEWCYKSPTGKLQQHDGDLVSVCPSGQYYQERIFDILDEVTRRYLIDGFFINWTTMNEEDYYKRYHGVCHCNSCQAQWNEYSQGLELPCGPADAHYTQWLRFSREVIDELTSRIRGFIAERLPSACLILGKTADIMFHEANNAVGRELWHHSTSEMVSSWISYRPDVPVLVNSTCFMDMPYRMASEEPAHFAQYLLQCISRGGYPSTYMMGTPGKIPYLCLDIAGEITRFHKKWKHVYDGLRPLAKTGLVLPDRAQMAATQFEEAVSEYRGLYAAMQELHIPFDVLAQERLQSMSESKGLERYEVLVLPNLGKLGQEVTDALDAWVSEGGHLISTGASGVGQDDVIQLKSLPSERQLEVNNNREQLFSTYFAPPQNEAHTHVYTGPIVPLHGVYHSFEWKAGSGGGYKMLARAPFSPPEKAYGNVQVEQRGYGTWNFDRGAGVVIPFTVGRGYRELGLGVFRDFFTRILREEGGAKELISCSIAEQVEVTVNENGSRLVVHLINMSGARKQNFGSHIPISSGTIQVLECKSNVWARALQADRVLEVKDGVVFLPTLDLFEVVVIEGVLN